MAVPKTVKQFLKLCIDISNTNRDELKGRLTPEEYLIIGMIRASVQNELGEIEKLLKRNKLTYK